MRALGAKGTEVFSAKLTIWKQLATTFQYLGTAPKHRYTSTILNYQQHTEILQIRALQLCWEILFILNNNKNKNNKNQHLFIGFSLHMHNHCLCRVGAWSRTSHARLTPDVRNQTGMQQSSSFLFCSFFVCFLTKEEQRSARTCTRSWN